MVSHRPAFPLSSLLICAGLLSSSAYAADVLATNGFQSCLNNGTIKVQKMNVKFDHSTNRVNFDVAGTSEKEQNVTAHLEVFAYGHTVYTKDFDPCGNDPHVDQLCPGMTLATPRASLPNVILLTFDTDPDFEQ